jgi:hypothetical protein
MQSRKCRHALSIPHSVSQWTNFPEIDKERKRETEKERKRESEKEGGREKKREMWNMVALFLFSKGMMGALEPFSYLVNK